MFISVILSAARVNARASRRTPRIFRLPIPHQGVLTINATLAARQIPQNPQALNACQHLAVHIHAENALVLLQSLNANPTRPGIHPPSLGAAPTGFALEGLARCEKGLQENQNGTIPPRP
jgi:hypothetical protein